MGQAKPMVLQAAAGSKVGDKIQTDEYWRQSEGVNSDEGCMMSSNLFPDQKSWNGDEGTCFVNIVRSRVVR